MIRGLLRKFFGARRALRSKGPAPHAAPHDPRAAADPWLGSILAQLGDRYRLGEDGADGTRILRRTGRERFNPMQVWLRSAERLVVGEYEVRAQGVTASRSGSAMGDSELRCRPEVPAARTQLPKVST